MSSRGDAVALWGAAVVDLALKADPAAPVDRELVRLVAVRARSAPSDAAFARWALTLPWPRFVELVRLVAGETRRSAMTMEN